MADFATALAYLTPDEGGMSPDGTTKYGITSDEAATVGYSGDLASMPYDPYVAAYLEPNYWEPILGDQIANQGPASAIFDIAVLTGLGGAGQITQAALAQLGIPVTMDGVIGPETIAAVNSADPNDFVSAFSAQAESYLLALPQAANNPGWQARAERLQTLQTGIAGMVAVATTNPLTTTAIIAAAVLAGAFLVRGRK